MTASSKLPAAIQRIAALCWLDAGESVIVSGSVGVGVGVGKTKHAGGKHPRITQTFSVCSHTHVGTLLVQLNFQPAHTLRQAKIDALL